MNSRYYEDLLARYEGVVSRTLVGEVLTELGTPFFCGCETTMVSFFHLPLASRVWGKYYHAVLLTCDGRWCNEVMEQFILGLDEYIDIVDGGVGLSIAA